jgi:hypothetical protein
MPLTKRKAFVLKYVHHMEVSQGLPWGRKPGSL